MPKRCWWMPVCMPARLGRQTVAEAWAWVYVMPALAMASIAGVGVICSCLGDKSSNVIHKMFGLAASAGVAHRARAAAAL